MQLGDFDLTILPKNEKIRFNVGYSPERLSGPAFTNYHAGGNEFNFISQLRSRANDYRFGADGKVGPIDFLFLQGFRRFRDDSFISLGPTLGINRNPAVASLTTFNRNEPTRGSVNYTRFSMHSLVAKKLDITGRIVYSKATSSFNLIESFTGRNWNPRVTGWPPGPLPATPNILNLGQYNITGETERPNTLGDIGVTYLATDKLRISNTFRVEDFEIDGRAVFSDFFSITRGAGATLRTDTIAFNNLDANRITRYRKYQNTLEGDYQFNAPQDAYECRRTSWQNSECFPQLYKFCGSGNRDCQPRQWFPAISDGDYVEAGKSISGNPDLCNLPVDSDVRLVHYRAGYGARASPATTGLALRHIGLSATGSK